MAWARWHKGTSSSMPHRRASGSVLSFLLIPQDVFSLYRRECLFPHSFTLVLQIAHPRLLFLTGLAPVLCFCIRTRTPLLKMVSHDRQLGFSHSLTPAFVSCRLVHIGAILTLLVHTYLRTSRLSVGVIKSAEIDLGSLVLVLVVATGWVATLVQASPHE